MAAKPNIKMDNTMWYKGMNNWESMCRHMITKSTSKANTMYYELYIKYFQRVRQAIEKDKIAVHATSIPIELIYAAELTPVLMVSSSWQMAYSLKNYEEMLAEAKEYGLTEEACSAHRMIFAWMSKGWYPKPKVFVHIGSGCDAFASSMRVAAYLYDVPDFYINPPYYHDEKGDKYLQLEFQRLFNFLEEQTGKKIDLDRFKEIMKLCYRQYQLFEEVRDLRKAIPSPMVNRRAWQMNWINWIYAGTQEAVDYFETLRDELKERVEQGKGPVPKEERFRVLDLFMHPAHAFKLLDWMQAELGVSVVAEELIRYTKEVRSLEFDPERPLEFLAKRWARGPLWATQHSLTREWAELSVEDALDYKADGAIWWDNQACRQVGAKRMLKDGLAEIGIPTADIRCDICDPGFVTHEEIRDKLEEFFEILEARK